MGDPGIATNDTVMSDDRISTQDSCARIDNRMVSDGRMPFALCFFLARVQRTDRNTLVNFYLFSDHGSFSDNDTGAVIDEEGLSNAGAGVNIDTRLTVGMLGEQAWQGLYSLCI